MAWKERIALDPKVLVGKPVIKGTRLAVEFIIDLLAQGWSETEILGNYPGLTHEDVCACLGYATTSCASFTLYTAKMATEQKPIHGCPLRVQCGRLGNVVSAPIPS